MSLDGHLLTVELLLGKCQGLTITPFNAGHTLGGTIWKIRSPSSGTIIYAVNVNHMRERHLDGTVLIRQAAGGIFEPLARPDLLITDADRAPVITSRRKDRDAALIGALFSCLLCMCCQIFLFFIRHHNLDAIFTIVPSSSLRLQHSYSRTSCSPGPTLELFPPPIPYMPPFTHWSRNVDFCKEYDGMDGRDDQQRGSR
jgi:hypothetical protein